MLLCLQSAVLRLLRNIISLYFRERYICHRKVIYEYLYMVLVQPDPGFSAAVMPIYTIEMTIETDESIFGNPPIFPAVTVTQFLRRERVQMLGRQFLQRDFPCSPMLLAVHMLAPLKSLTVQVVQIGETSSRQEILLEITDRTFHLPFRLRPAYLAGGRLEAHIGTETFESGKEDGLTGLVFQDNCLHVVCQHNIRNSAEIFESVQDAAFQAFEVTTLCEFHVPGPGVSQGHDESRNFMEFAICAQILADSPIHLGLSAGLGFIPWHSRDGLWRTKNVDIILDDGLPTGVTHLLQGLQDDDAVEYAIVHHLVDLRLKGIQNGTALMRLLRQSSHLHILLGRILGNILLFTDSICALAFSCTIAYYHNKPTSYHLDYLLTSLDAYYGNPFWYEVGHFFPALWVNYSPALTSHLFFP